MKNLKAERGKGTKRKGCVILNGTPQEALTRSSEQSHTGGGRRPELAGRGTEAEETPAGRALSQAGVWSRGKQLSGVAAQEEEAGRSWG